MGVGASAGALASSSVEPLPPTPRQLGRLNEEQLTQLWSLLTAEVDEEERHAYRASAVDAICELLEHPASKLTYLNLSCTALCGVDGSGKELVGCEYTAQSIERLCEALRCRHCRLTTLKLNKSAMRPAEARTLAAAVKVSSSIGPMMQTLILEGSALPVPQLLGIRELSQGLHKRFSSECSKLHPSEVTLISQLLSCNTHLELLDFNSSSLGTGLAEIATAIRASSMPLSALHLAENAISPALAVELIAALRHGAPRLTDLDLSRNGLTTLHGLHTLRRLKRLNLYYNVIGRLGEMDRLRQHPALEVLDQRLEVRQRGLRLRVPDRELVARLGALEDIDQVRQPVVQLRVDEGEQARRSPEALPPERNQTT